MITIFEIYNAVDNYENWEVGDIVYAVNNNDLPYARNSLFLGQEYKITMIDRFEDGLRIWVQHYGLGSGPYRVTNFTRDKNHLLLTQKRFDL